MARIILTVFILAGLSSGLTGVSYADGFSSGSTFDFTNISGRLTVFCNGHDSFDPGPQIGNFFCQDTILDPVEQDYFVTDEPVAANKVTLINKVGNREIKKTKSYSASKKQSTGRFNLAISTLLQTPLLQIGTNTIFYELKNDDQVVKTGQFVVVVNESPKRTCKNGTMSSSNNNDCRNSSFMCNRYFAEENYCQY